VYCSLLKSQQDLAAILGGGLHENPAPKTAQEATLFTFHFTE